MSWSGGWFPELADTRLRQVTWPAIAVHHDYIVAQMKAGVRMSTIWQRLYDEHGLAASVASLRRYVAANIPEEARRSQVTVCEPAAGRGRGAGADRLRAAGPCGWTRRAGSCGTVWAFVMVLACSRHMFVRPVLTMDQRAWTECHAAAFEFFGGVPARLVPDNLKTGVDQPDLYDPKINRSYAELAAPLRLPGGPGPGAASRGTRPGSSGRCRMSATRFWRGREFTVAGARCRPRPPAGRLEVAGPAGLPAAGGRRPRGGVRRGREGQRCGRCRPGPFVLATWATAKIGPDIHAQVDKVLYSVPWRHIGKTADVRITATMVQFFIGGDLVKSHPRKIRGKQTDFARLPAGEDRVPHADPALVPQARRGRSARHCEHGDR